MDYSLMDGVWNMILWSFVPSFITSFLLNQYYSRFCKQADRPHNKSVKYRRHYRRLYIAVICLYFAYCVRNCVIRLEPNYYKQFGIHRTRVESDLKPKFRQYAKSQHPDKAVGSDSGIF